ncbi:AEC family transporter [Gulosibacter faecalis]|jgi:predicted permease|uniref:AEC family transporter n=1 Tax=Gulosibacter faecalis TaxID=272240 RepID=A0ABW5V0F4_9MICO|nr:AEC family transporter [Gulosibacter faecalis]
MAGVFQGFAVIAVIILVGFIMQRVHLLGDRGREQLNKLAFNVATPALLFVLMYHADLGVLFSGQFIVTAICMVVMAAIFVALAAIFRWGAGNAAVGALASSFVNSGNLGIPIAVYVLGDGTLVAPVMLVQQLIIAPVMLSVLDIVSRDPQAPKLRWWQMLYRPFTNPVVIGALLGLILNFANVEVPQFLFDPIDLIGGISVPAVLMAFGMSLHDNAVPLRGRNRWQVATATVLKAVVHPIVAWLVAAFVFGLSPDMVLVVVVTAALPAAQNIYNYAANYHVGESLARETILLTTVLSVPAILVVTLLLHP